jgi:hypothetical protein
MACPLSGSKCSKCCQSSSIACWVWNEGITFFFHVVCYSFLESQLNSFQAVLLITFLLKVSSETTDAPVLLAYWLFNLAVLGPWWLWFHVSSSPSLLQPFWWSSCSLQLQSMVKVFTEGTSRYPWEGVISFPSPLLHQWMTRLPCSVWSPRVTRQGTCGQTAPQLLQVQISVNSLLSWVLVFNCEQQDTTTSPVWTLWRM